MDGNNTYQTDSLWRVDKDSISLRCDCGDVMVARRLGLGFFIAVLSGCGGIPSVPYQDPVSEEGTARVRFVTNSSVFGDSVSRNCAPSPRHKVAEAGRFQGSTPLSDYPQYPAAPSSLGMRSMPQGFEPELVQYIGAIRMAEGRYAKVVTEHRVRTDMPFQLASLGAAIGSYGSTYMVCKGGAKLYQLEPNKDYEAIVGVGRMPSGSEAEPLHCFFGMFELVSRLDSNTVIPLPLKSTVAPEKLCDD